MFSCTAGWAHMRSFIAGATSTGHDTASRSEVSMSSAIPWAALPTKLAVAGATTTRSALSVRVMWVGSTTLSRSNWSIMTRRRVRVWNVRGPTNWVADLVMTTVTPASRWTSWETTSAALYAAMEPVTPTTISLPLRAPSFFVATGAPDYSADFFLD